MACLLHAIPIYSRHLVIGEKMPKGHSRLEHEIRLPGHIVPAAKAQEYGKLLFLQG